MLRVLGAALLLFSGFAGCAGSDGCSVEILPPLAGARATYAAEGRIEFPSFNYGFIDWSVVGESGGKQLLVLPTGSELVVAVQEDLEHRLALDGLQRPTWRFDYAVRRPGMQQPVVFASEWLDAVDSHLVSEAILHGEGTAAAPIHILQLGRIHRPGVLATAPLWGRALDAGEQLQFPLPMPMFFAGMPASADGNISYEVLRTERVAGVCQAMVDVAYAVPELPGSSLTYRLQLVDGTSMPSSIHEVASTTTRAALHLELTDLQPGAEPRLAPWTQPPLFSQVPVAADLVPTRDGFLGGTLPAFPTTYPEALAAIQQNPQAASWFQQHPSATPGLVEHVMGAPGSDVVDEWAITWVDVDGTSRTGLASRQTPLVPLVQPETLAVSFDAVDDLEGRPSRLPQVAMSLDNLARAHLAYYGTEPEVLSCWLDRPECSIGTHEGMQMGYAGSSSFPLPGLTFDVSRGWALQEKSAIPAAVS